MHTQGRIGFLTNGRIKGRFAWNITQMETQTAISNKTKPKMSFYQMMLHSANYTTCSLKEILFSAFLKSKKYQLFGQQFFCQQTCWHTFVQYLTLVLCIMKFGLLDSSYASSVVRDPNFLNECSETIWNSKNYCQHTNDFVKDWLYNCRYKLL